MFVNKSLNLKFKYFIKVNYSNFSFEIIHKKIQKVIYIILNLLIKSPNASSSLERNNIKNKNEVLIISVSRMQYYTSLF